MSNSAPFVSPACAGIAISVERNSPRKEQSLEPLPLFERRLHPEVGCARQDALSECQDALRVEFLDLGGMAVHAQQRELLAQLLGVAIVDVDVDRPVASSSRSSLAWMAFARRSAFARSVAIDAFRAFQICRTSSFGTRM